METLEVDLASTKQELSLSKKRVAELQHALEDDMNYDSDGLSHGESDLSDDSDGNLDTSSVVPSEPRSYRSLEDLDNDDGLDKHKLKKKLSEIATDARSDSGGSTRKTSATTSLSPKSDKDDDKKRRSDHRSREDRRKKSIEKRKSLERMSRKAKGDTPGAFDI